MSWGTCDECGKWTFDRKEWLSGTRLCKTCRILETHKRHYEANEKFFRENIIVMPTTFDPKYLSTSVEIQTAMSTEGAPGVVHTVEPGASMIGPMTFEGGESGGGGASRDFDSGGSCDSGGSGDSMSCGGGGSE